MPSMVTALKSMVQHSWQKQDVRLSMLSLHSEESDNILVRCGEVEVSTMSLLGRGLCLCPCIGPFQWFEMWSFNRTWSYIAGHCRCQQYSAEEHFFTTMQELIRVASTNRSALRTSVFVPNGSPIAIRWALAKFCTNIGTHMKSRFKT